MCGLAYVQPLLGVTIKFSLITCQAAQTLLYVDLRVLRFDVQGYSASHGPVAYSSATMQYSGVTTALSPRATVFNSQQVRNSAAFVQLCSPLLVRFLVSYLILFAPSPISCTLSLLQAPNNNILAVIDCIRIPNFFSANGIRGEHGTRKAVLQPYFYVYIGSVTGITLK